MGDSLSTFLAVTQPANEVALLRAELEKVRAAFSFEFKRCEEWVGKTLDAEEKVNRLEKVLLAIEVLAEDYRSSREVDPVIFEIRDLARGALGVRS